MSHVNRYMRMFGAGAINVVGLAIVTTALPVFLCTSNTYMEFVLNAAATIFIVQLDDHTHDTTIVIKHQKMIPLTAGSQTDEYKEQHKQQANRKMMQLFEVEDEFREKLMRFATGHPSPTRVICDRVAVDGCR